MRKRLSKFDIKWPSLIIFGRRVHFYWIFLTVAAVAFGIRTGEKTFENYRLANRGKLIRAFVYETKKVGGKGTIYVFFRYKVDGRVYSQYQANEPYRVGDSVYLLYLSESPGTMRTHRFIKDNYNTDIQVPE